jgi:hypothetical protein
LEDMIQAFGLEILLRSPKGLENLEMVKKSIKGGYVWCWQGLSDTPDSATFCA